MLRQYVYFLFYSFQNLCSFLLLFLCLSVSLLFRIWIFFFFNFDRIESGVGFTTLMRGDNYEWCRLHLECSIIFFLFKIFQLFCYLLSSDFSITAVESSFWVRAMSFENVSATVLSHRVLAPWLNLLR